jgi:hypothetical protein
MKDRFGNDFVPVQPVRMVQDKCEITDCPSNSGFSCALSIYDHADAIRPDSCSHRRYKLRAAAKS